MEIQLPISTSLSLSGKNANPLQLKIGQKLDVSVISALSDKNAIQISMAGKIIEARSNQTIPVEPGQALKLQVIKISPSPELKILETLTQLTSTTTSPRQSAAQQPPILTLIIPQSEKKTVQLAVNSQGIALQTGQKVTATVTHILNNKIQLQLVPEKLSTAGKIDAGNSGTSLSGKAPIPEKAFAAGNTELEIKVNAALGKQLKVGQQIQLQVLKTTPEPTFEILSTDNHAENMTSVLRRLLPIQESAPIFLKQLIKDLPNITASEKLPETLKRLARIIVQNLPGKEQLKNGSTLQQSVKNSGIFLEAKIAGLPEKSSSHLQGDFKADLLKFLHSLKQVVVAKGEHKLPDADLTLMKELQQKTESSVAKLILDQLVSLPKEDNPKQLWSLEIPFIDKGKAESIKIEIENQNQNQQQAENPNWSVSIHITPPNLGTIRCKLSFYNNALQTHFWSEQPSTIVIIKKNLEYLKAQMQEAGIDPGHIDVHEGLPATPEKAHTTDTNLFQGEA